MKNKLFSEISKNGLAAFAGVLLTLACAPFSIFPLALISSALLISLWLDVSPRQAWVRGFCYGLGLFGSGVYWIYISMHTYAELASLAAGALTCLFIACLALFPAGQGWLLNRFFPRSNNSKILCAFPAIWVFIEWLRSWLFTGFPWLFLGYSQTESPLKGYAPLLSVYGISLATALSGALIANSLRYMRQKQYKAGYYNLLLFIFIWTVGGLLNLIPWTQPTGAPIQVSLIQANIPQQLKWLPEQVEPTLLQYKELTEQHWDSQVIVWPEAAIPAALGDVSEFVKEMAAAAKQHHSTLITGVPIKQSNSEHYYNAVISVGDTEKGFYLKHRLVPFGEFVPMEGLLGRLFGFLDIPMSELVAAHGIQEPLTLANGIKMLTFICYEIAFPEQVLYNLKDIGLILTVTNDAWFGHSIAQAQHLQMAQMRAIETGRPILFATNNGITAMISAKGNLLSAAPPFETTVLTGKIQPYTGKTPWQLYPMDPVLLIVLLLLLTAFKHRRA